MGLGKPGTLLPAALLIFAAAPAWANPEPMVTGGLEGLSFVGFIAWLILGLFLEGAFRGSVGIQPMGLTVLALCIISSLAAGLLFYIWGFYLVMLTVYLAWPRPELANRARIVSLLFHGAFLAFLVVGGIILKIKDLPQWGGWWTLEDMIGMHLAFSFFVCLVIGGPMIAWFWFRVIPRILKCAASEWAPDPALLRNPPINDGSALEEKRPRDASEKPNQSDGGDGPNSIRIQSK